LLLWEQKLQPSDAKDAISIIKSLTWNRLAPFIPKLGIAAMRSHNLILWGHILDATVKGLGISRRVLETVAFYRACDVFTFAPTVARLEQSLQGQGIDRLILVASIPEYDSVDISRRAVAEWRTNYTQHILQSSTTLGEEGVPILVEVVKQGDLLFVRDM
jgi:hypothetical protein